MSAHPSLSRRERQIIDILYRKGNATAAEVMAGMPDAPGYSAVRSHLATLEAKGHVRHEKDGARYVYLPTLPRRNARRSAIRHLIQTFFGGSREQAVAALLDTTSSELSAAELDRLAALIRKARGKSK